LTDFSNLTKPLLLLLLLLLLSLSLLLLLLLLLLLSSSSSSKDYKKTHFNKVAAVYWYYTDELYCICL